jgi:hypothetical protein
VPQDEPEEAAMNWVKTLLVALAVLHLLFGLYALYMPLQVAQLAEILVPTPAAVSEIRAVYGGLMIAVGAVLARGVLGGPVGAAWLRAAAVAYAGIFFGRAVSISVDGPTGYALFAGGFEIALAIFLGWAASELRRTPEPPSPGSIEGKPPTAKRGTAGSS